MQRTTVHNYTKGVCESRHVLLFGVSINVQSLFIQVYFRAALIPNFKYQVLLLNVQVLLPIICVSNPQSFNYFNWCTEIHFNSSISIAKYRSRYLQKVLAPYCTYVPQ